MTGSIKPALAELYRQYLNEFVTVAAFARFHEIDEPDAAELIEMGRKYHEEGY